MKILTDFQQLQPAIAFRFANKFWLKFKLSHKINSVANTVFPIHA
ncbi:hypothetical protein [Roseofilum sp. Guam]|nr:hypothetical protein [Roseofilum sp. Guam]